MYGICFRGIQMICIYNLNNEQHKSFIEYAFNYCDSISFIVENYNHSINNKQNILKDDYGNFDNNCYLHYQNTQKLIKELGMTIIRSEDNSNYGTQCYSYRSKIFYVRPNEKLKNFLRATMFESWIFPELPEDIIMYKKDKIWVETITHERIVWIHNECKEDIEFLKKQKISFYYEGNP